MGHLNQKFNGIYIISWPASVMKEKKQKNICGRHLLPTLHNMAIKNHFYISIGPSMLVLAQANIVAGFYTGM